MGRFEEEKSYGTLVTRTIQATGRGFANVLMEKRKPALSSTLNLQSDIQEEINRQILRVSCPSGVLERKTADPGEPEFVYTRDDSPPGSITLSPHEFMIQGFTAVVNGYLVDVRGTKMNASSFLEDWNILHPDYLDGGGNPPSVPNDRVDLIFLEVFLTVVSQGITGSVPSVPDTIYPLGNRQWGNPAYLPDDLIDTTLGNRPTDGRIQTQYQFRVIQDIDRFNYPDPMLDPTVLAQGTASTPTGYSFSRASSDMDPGLYVAGDGSSAARTQLGTVTGYSYAIPICLVRRRNNGAFALSTNINGSQYSYLSGNPSDRPDDLYYDEIAEGDIEDLRNQVSISNVPEAAITEGSLRQILEGGGYGMRVAMPQHGAVLLQADSIAVTPPSGTTKIAEPDGSRTEFTATEEVAKSETVQPGSTGTTGEVTVSHPGGTGRQITITTISPEEVGDVVLTWDVSGQPAAIISVTRPDAYNYEVLLDTTDSYFGDGLDLIVSYAGVTPQGTQFTYLPLDMLDVYLDPDTAANKVAFVESQQEYRSEDRTTGSAVTSDVDFVQDFNFLHSGYSQDTGYIRLETYYYDVLAPLVAFNINPTVQGKSGTIVFQVRRWDHTTSTWSVINPVSVQWLPSGGYTVTTTTTVPAGDVLEITLAVETKGAVWSKNRKGYPGLANTEWLTIIADGISSSFVLTAANDILSYPVYFDGATYKPFAYVGPAGGPWVRVDVTSFTIDPLNPDQITIQFGAAPAGSEHIWFPVVTDWAPAVSDEVVGVYNYKPYAGLSGLNGFINPSATDKFEVLYQGTPLFNSYGSGSDDQGDTWLAGIMDRVPRATLDTFDFKGRTFLAPPFDDQDNRLTPAVVDSCLKPLITGDPFKPGAEFRMAAAVSTKEQGIDDFDIISYPSLEDFLVSRSRAAFSDLSATGAMSLLIPYLIRDGETGELFILLVMVEIQDPTTGQDFLLETATAFVAYDLFWTKDRWLLPITK